MDKRGRILIACGLWVLLIGGAGACVKFLIFPSQKNKLVEITGSSSQYQIEVQGGSDSFPGYAPLRSEVMFNCLKDEGIKLTWHDDKADYKDRITKIRDGKLDIAVFTIDAIISSSIEIGEWPPPCTIISVIDQTKGADALLAWNNIKGISDLDREDARIIATPKSPSELISRIVVSQFHLPRLPENWMISANGSQEVLAMLKKSKGKPYAFALWEPEKSQALELPDVHTLIDTSQVDGLVVDVLVASRKMVANHPEVVDSIVEAHLRSVYSYEKAGMVDLIAKDANLDTAKAKIIVDGIQWANTMENYGYFGLVQSPRHLEDMIVSISDVLSKTGALPSINPVRGSESKMYCDKMLSKLQSEGFHPARKLTVLKDMAGMSTLDSIRDTSDLPGLSEEEWNKIVIVGNMKVNPITFGRGNATIGVEGERELRDLADRLSQMPTYYLVIMGNTSITGNPEANLVLAKQRAEATKEYLKVLGVGIQRMKTATSIPSSKTTSSVNFIIGQRSY